MREKLLQSLLNQREEANEELLKWNKMGMINAQLETQVMSLDARIDVLLTELENNG